MFPKNIHIQVAITTIAQKYQLPGVFYLDLWPVAPRILVITDPDIARKYTVLHNLPKHPEEAKALDSVIGSLNMVSANGQAWKRSHAIVAPAFGESQVKSLVPIISGEIMTFRQILFEKAAAGKPFELEDVVGRAAFDIICTTIFGFSLDGQRKGNLILDGFTALTNNWPLERDTWNPITKRSSRIAREANHKKIDVYVEKLIRERFDILHRDNIDVSKKRGLIIMDLLLRDRFQESKSAGKTPSEALDADFINLVITNIKTLLLAGTGTITDTVCFAYMLLSANPDCVAKLREEHDRVFGPDIESAVAQLQENPSKINELEYTTNVLKETLRMFPIGNTARSPLPERDGDFIEWNGIQYPTKDMMVTPVQHAMHMDSKTFSNPGTFDPDRFTRDDFPRHAWRPFERGPRACTGQVMAMDEMKAFLLFTVRDFDWECHDLKPFEKPAVGWWDLDTVFGARAYQEYVFEAKPRDGMPVVFKKRSKDE